MCIQQIMTRQRKPQSRQSLRRSYISHSVRSTRHNFNQSELSDSEELHPRGLSHKAVNSMPTATLATQTTIPSPPSTPSSSSNPQIVYLSGACGGTASCPSSDTPLDEEVPFQCPSLLSLSVSTLGRHVTKFVRCCGKLDFLPTDVRGCLIAAAR